MAVVEVMGTNVADKQRQKFSYFSNFGKEGYELKNFEFALKRIGLPAEETDPYREALSSEEALRAVFNWYRAQPSWAFQRFKPVVMPTLYIWPRNGGNVSQEAAEANTHYVEGLYRFEILEVGLNWAVQMELKEIKIQSLISMKIPMKNKKKIIGLQ